MTRIKDPWKFSHSLFQILVSLDTISDWPWWVSWQHFYSRSLPTEKLQATVPTSLKASHTLQYSFPTSTFKRTGVWGKSWSHQIYLTTKHFRRILVQTFNQFFPHPSLILRCEAYHKGALTIELKGINFQKGKYSKLVSIHKNEWVSKHEQIHRYQAVSFVTNIFFISSSSSISVSSNRTSRF